MGSPVHWTERAPGAFPDSGHATTIGVLFGDSVVGPSKAPGGEQAGCKEKSPVNQRFTGLLELWRSGRETAVELIRAAILSQFFPVHKGVLSPLCTLHMARAHQGKFRNDHN